MYFGVGVDAESQFFWCDVGEGGVVLAVVFLEQLPVLQHYLLPLLLPQLVELPEPLVIVPLELVQLPLAGALPLQGLQLRPEAFLLAAELVVDALLLGHLPLQPQ